MSDVEDYHSLVLGGIVALSAGIGYMVSDIVAILRDPTTWGVEADDSSCACCKTRRLSQPSKKNENSMDRKQKATSTPRDFQYTPLAAVSLMFPLVCWFQAADFEFSYSGPDLSIYYSSSVLPDVIILLLVATFISCSNISRSNEQAGESKEDGEKATDMDKGLNVDDDDKSTGNDERPRVQEDGSYIGGDGGDFDDGDGVVSEDDADQHFYDPGEGDGESVSCVYCDIDPRDLYDTDSDLNSNGNVASDCGEDYDGCVTHTPQVSTDEEDNAENRDVVW